MGRAMTFVARQIRDGITKEVMAIAIDEATAVVIDKNGLAQVLGDDYAYFILGDHLPEVCEPKEPLTFSEYKIWRLDPGETFNLQKIPTDGYYTISVKHGEIIGNPY